MLMALYYYDRKYRAVDQLSTKFVAAIRIGLSRKLYPVFSLGAFLPVLVVASTSAIASTLFPQVNGSAGRTFQLIDGCIVRAPYQSQSDAKEVANDAKKAGKLATVRKKDGHWEVIICSS